MANVDDTELRKLAADLNKSGGAIGKQTRQAVQKAAFDLEKAAKIKCPVDTGNLRNSISTEFHGTGAHSEMRAEIGPTALYGAYVEQGTGRMAPQPYMGPAADQVEPGFVKAIESLGGSIL